VKTEKGEALDFVQEKKEDDADFGVDLATPLKKDESATIMITYSGKNIVINEDNGRYYPTAREDWFPNSRQGLGDYATYHMLFHVPKGLQLVATGTKVSEKTEGKITTTVWKTDVPLPAVGCLRYFRHERGKGGRQNGQQFDYRHLRQHFFGERRGYDQCSINAFRAGSG
jgi:hypothetical protein